MDLSVKIPDPILTFLIRTRHESHCFDKIRPRTERFQTLCESVGGVSDAFFFPERLGEGRFLGAVSLSSMT